MELCHACLGISFGRTYSQAMTLEPRLCERVTVHVVPTPKANRRSTVVALGGGDLGFVGFAVGLAGRRSERSRSSTVRVLQLAGGGQGASILVLPPAEQFGEAQGGGPRFRVELLQLRAELCTSAS